MHVAELTPWRAALAERSRAQSTAAQGVYIHVPYCASRCGYCDFNTYTPGEIDVESHAYLLAAAAEIDHARSLWRPGHIDTVFIGGGTPTLLSATDLTDLLRRVDDSFGLADDAEVTVEANPDSVDQHILDQLREGGFTRISFGVQSLAPHVLAVLDRTHSPGRSLEAIAMAQAAGFEHVSADIIYATPGETDDDLAHTVSALLHTGIDHLSAYALIVEPGTRLANDVRRGLIPAPDDDVAADRYQIIDRLCAASGLSWYEISSWAKSGGECRHNLGYWRGGDWWAVGPGAHGHRDGLRWMNAKHPRAYTERIWADGDAVVETEIISQAAIDMERVMLGLRLREGLAVGAVTPDKQDQIDLEVAAGLLVRVQDRIVLTDAGRLLADGIVGRLTS